MLVLYALWRGVYLTHNSRIGFAVFSILPAFTQLLAVILALLAGWRRFDLIILASAVATLGIATAMMRPILSRPGGSGSGGQPWRALLSNGLHSFVQSVLMFFQPMAAYGLIRYLGGNSSDVGFMNLGLFLVQGLNVPITMISPLLFARWTAGSDAGYIRRLRALTWRGLAGAAMSAIVLVLAAAVFIPVVFGAQYGPAVFTAQVMLLTAPLVCHVRVVAPALHACGRPGVNTAALVLRLGTFVLGALLLPPVVGGVLPGIGIAWTLAEIATASLTLVALRYADDATGVQPRAFATPGFEATMHTPGETFTAPAVTRSSNPDTL
jgi:O-antigen/teichoic acid export membrane protein